jgi:NAD(P)-dependent dehydrogenase (short-subunit alcohol dehydrogenase family)
VNNVIVIVGAGSGIGLEVTKLALQNSSSHVLAVDTRFNDDFLSLEECQATRLTLVAVHVDAGLDWSAILQSVTSVRSIVFLIPPCRSRDLSVNDVGFSDAFSANVSETNITLLNLVRTSRQRLVDGSNLVLLSSVLSERIAMTDASLDYHAAKAVLETVMRFLAVKLGPKTAVNCIAPGLIARDHESVLYKNDELRRRVDRVVPLRRPCSQSEVARCIWSLSSGTLPYISGQSIVMDGGSSVLEPFWAS